jgi:hypothetical protein
MRPRQFEQDDLGRRGFSIGVAITLALGLVAGPGMVPGSVAQSEAEKGFEIAARSDRSDRGYGDGEVRLAVVNRNDTGEETVRQMLIQSIENPDEDFGDLTLAVFESPEDVAGTTLLSYANILTPDDQWLFLPALGRVTQISAANKTNAFVGSEFSFEDFTAQELNKFDYLFLREEPCGDLTCDVVERFPLYGESAYAQQISWFDQQDFQLRKVEFYDRSGDLMKTLNLEDYRLYNDAYWRPHLLVMVNHQSGKSTDLVYQEYRFQIGLERADFEPDALGGD